MKVVIYLSPAILRTSWYVTAVLRTSCYITAVLRTSWYLTAVLRTSWYLTAVLRTSWYITAVLRTSWYITAVLRTTAFPIYDVPSTVLFPRSPNTLATTRQAGVNSGHSGKLWSLSQYRIKPLLILLATAVLHRTH